MNARHVMMMHARCPVDAACWDYYEVTFEATTTVKVEDLKEAIDEIRGETFFQEWITKYLATRTRCRVTTRGRHGTTDTTVTCGDLQ